MRQRHRTAALAIALSAIVIVTSAFLGAVRSGAVRFGAVRFSADVATDPGALTQCFGANALTAPHGTCAPTTHGTVTPAPAAATADRSGAYRGDARHDSCVTHPPQFTVVRCDYNGERDINVALVGNSHAAQWFPAVESVARAQHWHLTTFLGSQCALAPGVRETWTAQIQENCLRWNDEVTSAISRGRFDLVVVANKISRLAQGTTTLRDSFAPYYQGYRAALQTFRAAGERVTVVRDSPIPNLDVPRCLREHHDDYAACDGARKDWVLPDPAVSAARSLHDPAASVVDLTDHICGPTTCRAVVGDVTAYYDASHLTATFARTLAPYLRPQLLDAAIRGRP